MGPGLGRTREICNLVEHILDAYEGALVLDADALYDWDMLVVLIKMLCEMVILSLHIQWKKNFHIVS